MKLSSIKMQARSFLLALLAFSVLLWKILLSFLAFQTEIPHSFIQCISNVSDPTYPISQIIYAPNNPSFQSLLESYIRNLRYMTPTTPKPLFIVTAKHESHIQATVVCSRKSGLQIRIRSCGHDLEGVSFVSSVPFIILDMFNLRSIDIDIKNETAWVQTGATLGELYHGIAKHSKVHAFPGGVCPTVCVGGHVMGGGYGNLMRKYGLSSDNIIDAVIVDVNGRIMDRKCMGENLFWAIRGGGASSFGVLMSYKIKLVRVPRVVTVFHVERTLEQGLTSLVYQWQHVANSIDENLYIRLKLEVKKANSSNKGKKTMKADFIALYLGQAATLLKLMNESLPELGLLQKDCIETSWLKSTIFWYDLPIDKTPKTVLLRRIPESEVFAKSKSDYLKKSISRTGLESLWQEMLQSEKVGMQWNPYGGKMNEISETESPFPHRKGNLCMIRYYIYWSELGEDVENYHTNLVRKLYNSMTPFVSKSPREAFLNYRDFDIGKNSGNYTDYNEAKRYGTKYFKNNFNRLVQVKTEVDPCNFFKNEQSIPSIVSSSRKKRCETL